MPELMADIEKRRLSFNTGDDEVITGVIHEPD